MLPEWTGEAMKRMHLARISVKELAAEIGWHEKYLSVVINGHRTPNGAEDAVMGALDRIMERRKRHE